MANRYSRVFTLQDIFNNKKLTGKIPLINLKETEKEDGKVSVRTNAKTVNRQVFDTAKIAARPFYKPFHSTQAGDILVLDGTLVGDHDEAVEAVYRALNNMRSVLIWTANNADLIRSAMKESASNKRRAGAEYKLYLRVQSMQEIEAMSKPQIQQLMTEIMENIYYGDGFPKTQMKWGLNKVKINSPLTYEQRQAQWERKVGIL